MFSQSTMPVQRFLRPHGANLGAFAINGHEITHLGCIRLR